MSWHDPDPRRHFPVVGLTQASTRHRVAMHLRGATWGDLCAVAIVAAVFVGMVLL